MSEDGKLNALNPSKLARYDSNPSESTGIQRPRCTENTRTAMLDDLNSWLSDPSAPHLMWMNGMAGTGKTTIACTYSEMMDKCGKLGASFFCSGVSSEFRDAGRIIPTIAYQLARFSTPFRIKLCAALSKDPDLGHSSIPKQFESLLRAPLRNAGPISGNIVVVVDALDECGDQSTIRVFLEHLVKYAEELPLKILITSRPEPEFNAKMKPSQTISLHEVKESLVQADIKLYLKQELAAMSLPDNQLMDLAHQCGTLFILAGSLVRYIQPDNPRIDSNTRLQHVLDTSSNSELNKAGIDLLYTNVLEIALKGLVAEELDAVRVVLRTVLCAQEPLCMDTIATLCRLDIRIASYALEQLRSIIHVTENNGLHINSQLVSTFHASFPDFMFNPERAGELFCNKVEHNYYITERCFDLMKKELRFNICQLESSYVSDERVTELQGQVDNTINPILWYTCRYWAEHLVQTTNSDLREGLKKSLSEEMKICLSQELKSFLSQRLLFWIEVLNLKRSIALGADILHRANSCLMVFNEDEDLPSLAEDARNFITSFAANPVSISTPHIYTSLLSFCPRSSAIFKCYWKCFQGLAEPDGRAMRVREVAALASWKQESEVSSVAYSHDGTRIAFGGLDGTVGVQSSYDSTSIFSVSGGSDSGHDLDRPVWSVAFSPSNDKVGNQTYVASGSDDGTVRTWNFLDGTVRSVCRPDPVPGTTNPGKIKSIAFSPRCDGSIASGSSDCTVCIWDSSDGRLIAGPFHGHTGAIWSVAFSPDGARLASGSDDNTIRIWNPNNGQLLIGPLTAQTDDINAIAFSLDGTLLASGSSDRTICVWDPHQGTVISEPFPAHNDKVLSVTFSPDGKYLASSSLDRTIRVWYPRSGKLAAGPFEGHIDPIHSIAFSPDNTRIISGSPDKTIQLWDPRKGTLGDGAIESHSDAIASVAFSPDGQHMASCSYDGTLRLWVVHDNIPIAVAGPLRGHTDQVLSLAFSPDGARIVTGSADQTAQVWDLNNKDALPVVLRGHSSNVWSVAFSPDGRFVVSAGGVDDQTIRMWDSFTGISIGDPLTGHTDEVKSVTVSPDGECLSPVYGSRDTTLRVWDLKEMKHLRLLQGHTRAVWTVIYSRDGTKLASCSSDGTIRVWNPNDGTLITGPILAHSGRVGSVAFSPDGNHIASGADDCTVRLWDTRTGELVAGPYEGHCDVIWSVAFSPSGTHIVSGSHDGTIRIWDINKNAPAASRGDAGTAEYFQVARVQGIDTNNISKLQGSTQWQTGIGSFIQMDGSSTSLTCSSGFHMKLHAPFSRRIVRVSLARVDLCGSTSETSNSGDRGRIVMYLEHNSMRDVRLSFLVLF
ncbi:hypothetical protein RSAG8_13024, partial [Rhizoctonia solani AG-8 WAC10335]